MTILFAPDKFKGSLDAAQVCNAMDEALREAGITFTAHHIPMADGGEGTSDMLTLATNGSKITCTAFDPLFRSIDTTYGLSHDGTTAFIEMASASGLQRLAPGERDPLLTTTFGTGQLIADAIKRNAASIVLGVGGSATNDGGMGMMEALGVKFLGAESEALEPVGKNLLRVQRIDASALHEGVKHVLFTAICDVNNPLYGPQGAAPTFAPQKGAMVDTVTLLDNGLRHFAGVVQAQYGVDVNFPGAGAGGGLGAAALPFLNIRFRPGIEFITEFIRLEERIVQSDFVFTGEGKVDAQTFAGKVVKGVADLCRKHGKTFFVVAGRSALTPAETHALGAAKVISLVNNSTSEADAMQNAFSLLKQRIKEEIIPLFL